MLKKVGKLIGFVILLAPRDKINENCKSVDVGHFTHTRAENIYTSSKFTSE